MRGIHLSLRVALMFYRKRTAGCSWWEPWKFLASIEELLSRPTSSYKVVKTTLWHGNRRKAYRHNANQHDNGDLITKYASRGCVTHFFQVWSTSKARKLIVSWLIEECRIPLSSPDFKMIWWRLQNTRRIIQPSTLNFLLNLLEDGTWVMQRNNIAQRAWLCRMTADCQRVWKFAFNCWSMHGIHVSQYYC